MSDTKPVLITREDTASMLGTDLKEVDRMIHRGELRTALERGARGGRPAKRVYEEDVLFIIQQAKKTAKNAPSPSFADRYTPEDASRLFCALKSGTSLEDCIISLKIHPSAAMAIKRAWDQVRGQVTLEKADLVAIEKMGLDGTFPLEGRDAVMDLISNAAKERQCETCRTRAAMVCRPCSHKKSGVGSRESGVGQERNGTTHEGEEHA